MLLMGSARSCGYCSTTIHHLWAHVERSFSGMLFMGREMTKVDQSQERTTQELHRACAKEPVCSRLDLLLRSPFQLGM